MMLPWVWKNDQSLIRVAVMSLGHRGQHKHVRCSHIWASWTEGELVNRVIYRSRTVLYTKAVGHYYTG